MGPDDLQPPPRHRQFLLMNATRHEDACVLYEGWTPRALREAGKGLRGEGPYRLVAPQKGPRPPDQPQPTSDPRCPRPFDETIHHNAGDSAPGRGGRPGLPAPGRLRTLLVRDMDGDGRDEIVAGGRVDGAGGALEAGLEWWRLEGEELVPVSRYRWTADGSTRRWDLAWLGEASVIVAAGRTELRGPGGVRWKGFVRAFCVDDGRLPPCGVPLSMDMGHETRIRSVTPLGGVRLAARWFLEGGRRVRHGRAEGAPTRAAARRGAGPVRRIRVRASAGLGDGLAAAFHEDAAQAGALLGLQRGEILHRLGEAALAEHGGKAFQMPFPLS